MEERDWRERLLEIPAWVAIAASEAVLVGGWQLFGPDQERPPQGMLLLALLLLMPAIARASKLRWWRMVAFVVVFVVTAVITAQISSLALWLLVALAIEVPLTWWVVDRAYEAGSAPGDADPSHLA